MNGMLTLLTAWAQRGWIRELDRAFAAFLAAEEPDAHPLLLLAAALASHQLGRGHVCLDLEAALSDSGFALSLPPDDDEAADRPALPSALLADLTLDAWKAALQNPSLVSAGAGNTPLVLTGARLYLRRYWQHERDVRAAIDARLAAGGALRADLPSEALRQTLDALFAPADHTNWQKLACALAAGSAFSIITGGPGTGKTTTVVKLLALLQGMAMKGGGRPLRIRLAAPTGKAAARLNESIAGTVQRLELGALVASPQDAQPLREKIPTEVTTLHRLLGSRPDSRNFRHHAGNLLALDVLVVDEASMVDLEMMAATLAAMPVNARLVLLGDKDQLASVEAGAVLGELCRRAGKGHYWPATRDWLAQVTGEAFDAALLDDAGKPLDQAIAMLRHSHRFDAASGIGRLAQAVNDGDVKAVEAVFTSTPADIARVALELRDDSALRALAVDGGNMAQPIGYRHYLRVMKDTQPADDADQAAFDEWARQVLSAYGQFQVLCALRRGPWGVDGLNGRIAQLLQKEDLIEASQTWYLGRPVLVTRNDYGLGLMNGDVGVTLALPHVGDDGVRRMTLRVAFASGRTGPSGTSGESTIKWVLPSRLQSVESVYAMTVHKAQGSEFTHAALVLPERASAVLTRELVYTGVTRARKWFTLASAKSGYPEPGDPKPAEPVLQQAVQRRIRRASGLLDG